MRKACSLMREEYVVSHVAGPNGERVDLVDIRAWKKGFLSIDKSVRRRKYHAPSKFCVRSAPRLHSGWRPIRTVVDPAILPHTHVAFGSAKRLFEFCNRGKFAPRHQR